MKTRKHQHTVDEVLNALSKKNDIRIDSNSKLIRVLSKDCKTRKNDLGNGSCGKIDFLTNHCGYHLTKVLTF